MDTDEFDALYEAQWARLVSQVSMVCGDRSEAADCVQEAFVRAWEKRGQLDADAGGWVRTTALRISVSRWRKARNALSAWSRQTGERGLGEASLAPGHEHDAPVWQALAALPQAQREALVMHHVLDMPLGDVADLLGAPLGTVKARLSRGRTALAAALDAGQDLGRPRPTTSRPDGLGAVPLRTEGLR